MLDSAQPTWLSFPHINRHSTPSSLLSRCLVGNGEDLREVPPVWRPGRDSTKMLYDLRGRENNINGNSPSNTLTGMNWVPPSPSKWTCIDRRNPWINLALIDFFSSSENKSLILSRGSECSRLCNHLLVPLICRIYILRTNFINYKNIQRPLIPADTRKHVFFLCSHKVWSFWDLTRVNK